MAKAQSLWDIFTKKFGKPSKTSFFMSAASLIALFLWFFQSLFEGARILTYVVPEFDYFATGEMLIIFAGLYLWNQKVTLTRTSVSAQSSTQDGETNSATQSSTVNEGPQS